VHFLTWIITYLQKAFEKASKAILLAGYNQRTICKYFRKQGATIGEGCCISIKNLGPQPYLVSIGNNVWIIAEVVFHTYDGGVLVFTNQYPNQHLGGCGPIIIEDNVVIGRRAQLLPNIRIGRNSIVGAGSVVISDIPPNSIAMGVPARVIGSFAKYEEKFLARMKLQKPPDLDENQDWRSKKNQEILKRHLINLYINHQDKSEEISEK
jgi:acetyltransferase-like isoleucine patch superfamily enzyme